jgi:prolyl-tRNA synthetase
VNELDLGRELTAADTLKNVVVKLTQPGAKDHEVVAIGVPGDREVDFKRLEASLGPAAVEIFEAADFERHPELVRGYIGPQELNRLGIRYLADPRVVRNTSWITGANRVDVHVAHCVAGRDFHVDGFVEAAEVRAGDPSPVSDGTLSINRGIEIGHIFQLGTFHADVFELDALGPDSRPIRITMGSYGIGISRAVGAIAEQTLDEQGLCWPRAVAPADVHVVATGKAETIYDAAEKLAADLESAGLRILYDDRRAVSPGVKFNDAELIGVPTIVIVGRGLADGMIEIKDRKTGDRESVEIDRAVDRLVAVCHA